MKAEVSISSDPDMVWALIRGARALVEKAGSPDAREASSRAAAALLRMAECGFSAEDAIYEDTREAL